MLCDALCSNAALPRAYVCTSRTHALLTEKHATASSRREGEKVRSTPDPPYLLLDGPDLLLCTRNMSSATAPASSEEIAALSTELEDGATVVPPEPTRAIAGTEGGSTHFRVTDSTGYFCDRHTVHFPADIAECARIKFDEHIKDSCGSSMMAPRVLNTKTHEKGGVAKLRRDGMTIECAGRPPREMLFGSCSC